MRVPRGLKSEIYLKMCIYISLACKKKFDLFQILIQPRNSVFPKLVNTRYSDIKSFNIRMK
jgi:hypothetical protein